VQSLAFPLALPVMFGYVMAINAATSGSPSTFFDVLAYLPPTAPLAMPVLVSLGAVARWQFALSAVISIGCTIAAAPPTSPPQPTPSSWLYKFRHVYTRGP
jgi:hypothetical protein